MVKEPIRFTHELIGGTYTLSKVELNKFDYIKELLDGIKNNLYSKTVAKGLYEKDKKGLYYTTSVYLLRQGVKELYIIHIKSEKYKYMLDKQSSKLIQIHNNEFNHKLAYKLVELDIRG